MLGCMGMLQFLLPLIIKFYFSEVAGTCEIVFVVIF